MRELRVPRLFGDEHPAESDHVGVADGADEVLGDVRERRLQVGLGDVRVEAGAPVDRSAITSSITARNSVSFDPKWL